MDLLRIGMPSKGRLEETAGELIRQAGLSFRRQDRALFARCREMPVELSFLRPEDIPVLCAEGALDLGITGSDLVAETGADVAVLLQLGVGHCRLAVCVPEDAPIRAAADLKQARVATSFPRVTAGYFASHGVSPHVVAISGSVELMIGLGVAEAVVDLVETGSTLAANRLRILEEIGRYQTVLIQNRQARFPELVRRVTRRLEGVIIARGYSLLEYNIPRDKLAEAEKITPGFKSPTVSALEDPAWRAVRAMVKREQVLEIMERLESLGASAILETQITNCRL